MRHLLLGLVAALVVAVALGPAAAQPYLRVDGWVQWIAADKMVIVTDSGPSVAVDLSRAPLEDYRTLRQRERVAVIGVPSSDGRRLVATSIARVNWGGESP